MSMSLKSLMLVGAVSLSAFVAGPAALGAEVCPNEQLRAENKSLDLPDCRAYELASPDLNHAEIQTSSGRALSSGEAMIFETFDASSVASSGEAAVNYVRARRDDATGWHDATLTPPLVGPPVGYQDTQTQAVSPDLSTTTVVSPQPLSGGSQTGFNLYVGSPGTVYHQLTPIAGSSKSGYFVAGNTDFSHVYFTSGASQLVEDPLPEGNTYSWSEAAGLHLVGVLPDGTLAPGGGALVGNIIGPISGDGSRAVFVAGERVYLHIEGAPSLEVSASQRTINPDPNPGPRLAFVDSKNPAAGYLGGITNDGSRILFVASSELTNDANTGSTGGIANDAGADLYSYDVATHGLEDLTVDTDPADAASGANVRAVLGASPDGSYIYFSAVGHLAGGASSGRLSLYVWHDGEIRFVADASNFYRVFFDAQPRSYVSSNGLHIVFSSTASLTGYDNTDPITGQPHVEIFEATVGSALRCVSCRPDGTRPTADTLLTRPDIGNPTVLTDDGRLFFESADAILPEASNGRTKVFEYSGGKVSLISPGDSSSSAVLLTASSSGNDVFFSSRAELVSNPNGGDDVVYDARVDGGFPSPVRHECSGAACQAPPAIAPLLAAPGSSTIFATGNVTSSTAKAPAKTKVAPPARAEKLKRALRACKTKHNKKKRVICEKSARKRYGRRR